jgi:Protein of unknown function (DUF1207)
MKRITGSTALIAVSAALLTTASAGAAERIDCRYSIAGESEASSKVASVALPDSDVFRPILADQREPRFYADYRRVHFRSASSALLAEGKGQHVSVGMVAFGGEFGIWGLRQARGCDGLQTSMFGVVLAQFNLDATSADLLNADYLVGPMVTYRKGPWSGRLRFYHQSSHLGDEFLLNFGIAHGVKRQNLSIEVLDLVVSVEDAWWRVYAGGGVVAFSDHQSNLAGNGLAEWGLELRSPDPVTWVGKSALRPVFGASFANVEPAGWSINGSLEGGVEFAAPDGGNRVRALAVAQRGALPFSQFFFEKTDNLGIQLQFEF